MAEGQRVEERALEAAAAEFDMNSMRYMTLTYDERMRARLADAIRVYEAVLGREEGKDG